MKIIPILFSDLMVKSIDLGNKTNTRRIIKYSKIIQDPQIGFSLFTDEGDFSVRGIHENGQYGESFFKKPYNKGDILYVRETFYAYGYWQKNGISKHIKIGREY